MNKYYCFIPFFGFYYFLKILGKGLNPTFNFTILISLIQGVSIPLITSLIISLITNKL